MRFNNLFYYLDPETVALVVMDVYGCKTHNWDDETWAEVLDNLDGDEIWAEVLDALGDIDTRWHTEDRFVFFTTLRGPAAKPVIDAITDRRSERGKV